MKHKVYKIMVAVFVLCFIFGCDENTDKDIGRNSEKQNTESRSVITESVISEAELTPREDFYLNSFAKAIKIAAFDAVYSKDFHSLTYKLYNFKNNQWHKMREGSYDLEGNIVWIVARTDLTEFNIAFGDGKTMISEGSEPLSYIHKAKQRDAVLKESKIEKGKEFPIIAYRECGSNIKLPKSPLFSDFEDSDEVIVEENENYLMLTLTFE